MPGAPALMHMRTASSTSGSLPPLEFRSVATLLTLTDSLITVRTSDRGALTRHLARTARDARITLHEIRPTDESLESVFSYLVDR